MNIEDHEVTAASLARPLGVAPSNVPLRVLTSEIPMPCRRTPGGFRWRIGDIRKINPDLADKLIDEAVPAGSPRPSFLRHTPAPATA